MDKQKYYQILDYDLKYCGHQYTFGLNKLVVFDNNPNNSCSKNRLYVTTSEHIRKFFGYGVWLVIIELPTDDPEFKIVEDPLGDRWGVNILTITEKHSLFDQSTYDKIGLSIRDNYSIVDMASSAGNYDFLEWYVKYLKELNIETKYNVPYTTDAIDNASANGHTKVLEWWNNSGLYLKYTDRTIVDAIKNNRIEVLEWWSKSGLRFKVSSKFIYGAIKSGNIPLLNVLKQMYYVKFKLEREAE
jgi:hypothetical protein